MLFLRNFSPMAVQTFVGIAQKYGNFVGIAQKYGTFVGIALKYKTSSTGLVVFRLQKNVYKY